ncbi:hypothetical protein JHK87_040370 [Glycine soja]|nr:hypothetical protein JHK87_040370 [Glycine soja]
MERCPHVWTSRKTLLAKADATECGTTFNFAPGLKARDWSLVFRHTLREDNACAHWLANYRAAHDDRLKNLTPCPTTSLKHTSVRGIGQDVQRSKCWQIDTPFFASQSAILLPSISVLEYNLPIKMIEPLNFANNRLVVGLALKVIDEGVAKVVDGLYKLFVDCDCTILDRCNPGKTPLSRGNNTSYGVVIREDKNPRNSSNAIASRAQMYKGCKR